MRRACALVAAVAVLAALGGCTDVPSTSSAQRVESIPPEPIGQDATITPRAGEPPRQIVQDFLQLNASADPRHNAARQFLTKDAAARWSDTTATIVAADADESVGYDAKTAQVTVSGRPVGALDEKGIYAPSLQGAGNGGNPIDYLFGIKKVDGQYRIDKLPNGLLLTLDRFLTAYKQYPVYFFDTKDRYVVPDLRSTALSGSQLQIWLLARLAGGPRPDLAGAVDGDTFPTQASGGGLNVVEGDSLKIDVPGAAQLGADARNRLGAQIALTLDRTTVPHTFMTIVDGAQRIQIPAAAGTQFVPAQFSSAQPAAPPAEIYYLRDQRVVSASGRPVKGFASAPNLSSIGVARRGVNDALTVAGVVGTGPFSQLYVGTEDDGLQATSMRGLTSRPAWAQPGLDEVWAGTGPSIARYLVGGGVQTVAMPPVPVGTQVIALRLSPEGSRIALVEQDAAGNQRLFVGSVVRTADKVRIDTLVPISPQGVSVLDVSWLEETRLLAIGYLTDSQDSRIVETNVDGSDFRTRGIGRLPEPPSAVTVVANHLAWVSAGGSVWEQDGADWVNPGFGDQPTGGDVPVYLE